MHTISIAFMLLWKRKLANCILLLQVLISICMLAQVFVFIGDRYDSVRAVNELPCKDTVVLSTFDYYSPDHVNAQLLSSPYINAIGQVKSSFIHYDNTIYNLALYNQAVIENYSPRLQNGIWFSNYIKDNSPAIPAVVSADMGLKIGSEVEVSMPWKQKVRIVIIGMLKQPLQYLFPLGAASPAYFQASYIIAKEPVIILREKDFIDNAAISELNEAPTSKNLILFLQPNLTDATIQKATQSWNKYGEISSMTHLISNYTAKTNISIHAGVITFVVFFMLAFTCILSNSVIQSMHNQYMFTVYYLTGMNWKNIIATELCRIGILIILMSALTMVCGQLGLLMLEWMTPLRKTIFFGIAFMYIFITFLSVDAVFLHKLMKTDISEALKELQQGE